MNKLEQLAKEYAKEEMAEWRDKMKLDFTKCCKKDFIEGYKAAINTIDWNKINTNLSSNNGFTVQVDTKDGKKLLINRAEVSKMTDWFKEQINKQINGE